MKANRRIRCAALPGVIALAGLLALCGPDYRLLAQQLPDHATTAPGPMLAQGVETFDTPDFTLSLVRSSQTIAALKPKRAVDFDFTPGDLLSQRSRDGYYHLGDLDLRLRRGTSGPWKPYSTALTRRPVVALSAAAGELAAADLAPTLPTDIPLQITRSWNIENGKLILRYVLKNKTHEPVEIGALGIPMIFNNDMNGRSLEQAHAICSFYDPYIGEDAGYLQVTRLNGHGPALLVVPDGKTPFEAYKPILNRRTPDGKPEIFNDPTPRGMTFEGFYDWMVHSEAYQEDEWSKARPWNPATSVTLAPGESRTYGVKFLISDSIQDIEKTLASNRRPVAIGIPGYVLPTDIQARLFLKYPEAVRSIEVQPSHAIEIRQNRPTNHGWQSYTLQGRTWGQARITITYSDGLRQTISYRVIKPEALAVADLGQFLTTKQWFTDPGDPFHRAPSVMSYDREANAIVKQDSRVWIAGLSDEAGAGSWLAAAMKELGEPSKQELDKYQLFVDEVLWGELQYKVGANKFGVRKSLFYYQPDELPPGYYQSNLDWTSWTSWNKRASEAVDRSFNYPHVAAAYWVLYRLARNHQGLVTNHPWEWYLRQAYETSMAMSRYGPDLAEFGQMEGDVFVQILKDLKDEGMAEQASALEAGMRKRAEHWNAQAYPFGSEMPWDSTGQEEVYAWTKYFGYSDKAEVTLDAILGYDPAIPSWGYNGSARRYWDFIYGGKYRRLERQLHHYGSGINAIPLLGEYRDHPNDLYLLRVGYGGTMGVLTNIDQEGFASAAFHAFPDMLKFDPYSGDYGPNFFGFAWNTATYVVDDPELGWLSFGGNLKVTSKAVGITPLDAFRSRIYIAPAGLWLTLDAGKFSSARFDRETRSILLTLDPASQFTQAARLQVEQPAHVRDVGEYRPVSSFKSERGAYVIPLGSKSTTVMLTTSH
jgi:hypothetical protein